MRQTAVTPFIDQYEDRNFYQVTYPEPYIFAHSRHTYIDLDELRDQDNVPNSGGNVLLTITDTNTNLSYNEYRRTDERGKATWDIGRFLQIMMEGTLKDDAEFDYNTNSKMVNRHYIYVGLQYNGVYFFQEYFEVVNGADEPTDNWWDGTRRLHWWYNYPFTFDFRNLDEASIQKNDGAVTVGNLPQITPDNYNYSRIRINPQSIAGLWANKVKVMSQAGMGFRYGSFSGAKTNTVVLIGHVCTPNEKYIYLRWLNRHGELNYWLFNRQSLTRKTKVTDSQRAYIKDERFAGYGIDNALLRTLTVEGEIKCFTDALDGIDYEVVRQIFTAPFVDLYLPAQEMKQAQWQRVHIKAETQTEALRHADKYTYTRQVTITLTLPEEGQLFV